MIQKQISIANLTFDCRLAGKETDPLIIFLHGFPETSIMWKNIMSSLSSDGYFCLAPNQRGYSINACPKGKKNYRLEYLVQDVIDLANYFNKEKFHLVGHDWGALVGWNVVGHHKERILSWTALSVPHPRAFGKALKIDENQRKKSGYIKKIMIPFLPEMKIRKNDFEQFRKIWHNSSEEEVNDYLKVFRNKRCLTAALDYYRGNFGRHRARSLEKIDTPTLFIWGIKEKYIGETAADLCKDYMNGDYKYLKLDGGHWLAQTNSKEVIEAIGSHLSSTNNTST